MNELKASPKGRISLFGRRRSAGSASQSEAMTIAVGFVSVYRGGSARASRAVFGALAEHAFRSARAPSGAAEAAALPDAKHILGFRGFSPRGGSAKTGRRGATLEGLDWLLGSGVAPRRAPFAHHYSAGSSPRLPSRSRSATSQKVRCAQLQRPNSKLPSLLLVSSVRRVR